MENIISYINQEVRAIRNIFDDSKKRERAIENLITLIKEKYAKEKDSRVVCLILEQVAKDGKKIDEAIETLSYWEFNQNK